MPRISQDVIDSVFYLYANKQDAVGGISPGGTGFVVAVSVFHYNKHFTLHYGVTNWHVACHCGFPVIRLNKRDGGTDVLELGPEDWHFIGGGPDVAVVPLELDRKVHKIGSVADHLFAGNGRPSDINIGDDVFMVGLFQDHAGKTTNIPSARFGNISMLPSSEATIKQPTKYEGESFVLDLRSRAGYSGSPVFMYRTPGADLSGVSDAFPELHVQIDAGLIAHQLSENGFTASAHRSHPADIALKLPRTMFRLLGVHWGQFPERWERENPDLLSDSRRRALIPESAYVSGLSGMTCVIPAWEIRKVIDMPRVKALRDEKIKAMWAERTARPAR